MKASRWIIPQHDSEAVGELARALRIQPLTARVLIGRGFDEPDAARRYLFPSLEHLHDAALLAGMGAAVQRLRAAINGREKILIYGDYDVDGTTSVVMLKKAIEMAGGQADFHVPHRLKDGYGMRAEVIEHAAAAGVRLIVSVDTGIRANEVVRGASELGIDVIVTDHHLPERELPPAVAVVNPNRPDCTYPNKNLCGAGVAFKLVQALLGSLDWPRERYEKTLRSFLKLAAIATVADVVPLTGENRIIVKFGLEGLRDSPNPGLRALLEVSGLLDGGAPSAREIAFQVAPRINAAGRMAHAADVIRMFLSADAGEARAIAARLHELNQERQQTEADIVQAILEECGRSPVTDEHAALVFSAAGWHRGVVGIAASKMVERFCRPVFILGEEDERAEGSGRSSGGFHLLEALESMSDLFTRFGGHRQAAGLSMHLSRVAEFRERLNAYASARLTPDDFRPRLFVDAVVNLPELTDRAALEILSLAPFGFGNPAPLLAVRDAEFIGDPAPLKEKHLRLRLRQNGKQLFAKAWNFAERAGEFAAGERGDVVFSVEEDQYAANRGWPGWCATVRDVREVGSEPAGGPDAGLGARPTTASG
ncbi:MAG: single-stranded-DNA-specific exonuclease RecJ [Acidobacteriota bacterium]|nr:single-stranded-DNA-specific exonuclease RecJ [Acidobacteriota bacterium]